MSHAAVSFSSASSSSLRTVLAVTRRIMIAVLCIACATLAAAQTAITLPIEVMGPAGTQVAVPLTLPNGSAARTVKLRLHNVAYDGKVGVQMNGAPRVDLSKTTPGMDIGQPAKRLGGIGGGGAMVMWVSLPLAAGVCVNGANTLTLRFNQTDGRSSGFRVLAIDVLNSAGTSLVPAGAFVQDDPTTWTAPQPTQVAAGATLWRSATLLSKPGGTNLQVHCMDCHTQDGRDLAYFAYSNHSIIERSKFHGLTQSDGERIASYIRSLPVYPYGRPWNPPYQPGPGLDSAPKAAWAAGAGVDAVLADDLDIKNYLPDQGANPRAFTDGPWMKPFARHEYPLSVPLPDWNHWLSDRHPLDSYGTVFANSPLLAAYQTLRTKLTTLTGANRETYLVDIYDGLPRDLNLFHEKLLDFKNVNGSPNTQDSYDRLYGLLTWSATKHWELMQEFGLEGLARTAYGVNASDRQWMVNRTIFDVAPHILGMPIPNTYHKTAQTDANDLNYDYFSNVWYEVQAQLNSGARKAVVGGFHALDWAYSANFVSEIDGGANIGMGQKMLVSLNSLSDNDNGLGIFGYGDASADTREWWGFNEGQLGISTQPWSSWSDNAAQQLVLSQTTLQLMVEKFNGFPLEDYRAIQAMKPNGNWGSPTNVTNANYYSWSISRSSLLCYIMDEERARHPGGMHEAVWNGLTDWMAMLWPLVDWDSRRVAPSTLPAPTGVIATPGIERVTLSWQPVAGAVSYNVKRAETANGFFRPIQLLVNGTTFTDTFLTPGRTWYYRITANDAHLESVPSSVVSAAGQTGLIGWWSFDNTSTAGLQDKSITGNHGEVLGPVASITGRLGNGVDLSGGRAAIGVRRNLGLWLRNSFTAAAWVRTTALGNIPNVSHPDVMPAIMGSRYSNQILGLYQGHLGGLYNGGGRLVSTALINDGAWHHVATTRDMSTGEVVLYVDGRRDGSGFADTGISACDGFALGRSHRTDYWWPGALDEVRLYDYVLTAAEIAQLANPATATAPEIAVTRGATAIADGGSDNVTGTIAATTASLTYTVSNTGNAALTTSSAATASASNCTATIATQPATSIAAAGSSSLILSVTPTAAGAWSVTVSFGNNDSDENPYNWTISGTASAATAPVITSALAASGTVGSAFTYTITASGTTPITFGATPLPAGLTLNTATGVISGVPSAAATTNVTVSATNNVGTAPTKTLVITIAPLVSGTQETLFGTKTGPAVTNDGAQYELGTVFRSSVAGHITQVRCYAVAQESGAHAVRIWNTATGAKLYEKLDWIFGGSAGWVQFDIPDLAISAGTDYTISVSTGTDTAHAYAAITGDLAAAGTNGQRLSWLANAGVYSTTLGVKPTTVYQGTNYLRDVIFVAASSSTAPTITSTAPTTATVGTAYTYTITTTGNPASTLTVSGLPAWLTRSGATLAGTPTAAGTAGPITVTASNGVNPNAVQTFSIAVSAASTAPTITTQPINLTVAPPTTATFKIVASGSATLTYQWQSRASSSGTFANIAGATSASYTTPATTTAMSGTQYQCVVTNGTGSATSAIATLTVNAAALFNTKINFQPASAPAASGYLIDGGQTYAARNGQTYGWSRDISADTRDRNSTLSPDQQHDTLVHMQKSTPPTWNIAVPAGTYRVRVVVGDPSYTDTHAINVEGVQAISGATTAANRWLDNTITVIVTDGTLTLSVGSGGRNTKLDFTEIVQVSTAVN